MKIFRSPEDENEEPHEPRADSNQVFDIDHWISVFPLSDYRFSGNCVVGPSDVAVIEQIRQKAGGGRGVWGRSVPTDVFVFGKGGPADREGTRIGGVPYRPASLPWPEAPDGTPMTFLAQYSFAESTDIVGCIPGNVLLVFTVSPYIKMEVDGSFFHFEWYPAGIEGLISVEDVPPPAWKFINCYGVRHRSVDYLDDDRAFQAVEAVVSDYDLKISSENSTRMVYCYCGMKIGGVPFWFDQKDSAINTITQTFLCSLSAINPVMDEVYPWVNVASPVTLHSRGFVEDRLDWYDGFTVNYFLDEEGKIRWYAQRFF